MVTSSDHFAVLDGVLSPQPWAQYRMVVSETAPVVHKIYGVGDGSNKNDLLQTLQTHWTNNSPIDQYVYGMVGHGGSQVALRGASRGYITESHGFEISADGDAIPLVEVSRFGTGVDRGDVLADTATDNATFVIADVRNNSNTVPFMPQLTGWFKVAPGEKFNARVETRFISEAWEDMFVFDGGTENDVHAGELTLSLYAIPVIGPSTVGDRGIPTVVGGAITTVVKTATQVCVAKPTGIQAGDVLIAIVANQFGLGSDIQPPDDTWIKKANVNGSLAGIEEAHLKVFTHLCGPSEPDEYCFANGIFAEMTIHLIGLRGAEQDFTDGWLVSTRFVTVPWDPKRRDYVYTRDRWAPSITGTGQVLLASSYLSHGRAQQDPVYSNPGYFLSWNTTTRTGRGDYRMGVSLRFKSAPGKIVAMRFARHADSATRSRRMLLYKGTTLVAVSEPTRENPGGGWVEAKLTKPVQYLPGEVFTAVWPEPGGTFFYDDGVPTVDSSGFAEYVGSVISAGASSTAFPQPDLEPYMRYADIVVQTVVTGTGMTQESPAGMTELGETNGIASTMTTAGTSPTPPATLPNPTGERLFKSSTAPKNPGDGITVSILVPGARSGTLKS